LAIAFQGRQVEIGKFLTEQERCELAAELEHTIRQKDWRLMPVE
jgi:uncharacterized membrane protein